MVLGALRNPSSGAASVVLDAVDVVMQRLRADLAERAGRDDAVRRSWQFIDLVGAIVRGIVTDRLLERPEGYAAVDDVDYRDWLVRHGAGRDTIESPLVRVVYDLVFGYEQGEESRPSFSAGTGLLLSGKMFFEYRGAIFWKMTAGMGDVVFAPLHDALRSRGVEFRFFHRVDRLRLDDSGTRIDAVDIGVQVRLRGDVGQLRTARRDRRASVLAGVAARGAARPEPTRCARRARVALVGRARRGRAHAARRREFRRSGARDPRGHAPVHLFGT